MVEFLFISLRKEELARQPLDRKYRHARMTVLGTVGSRLAGLIGRCASASTEVEVKLALTMGLLIGVESPATVAVFGTLRYTRSKKEALLAASGQNLSAAVNTIFECILQHYVRLEKQRNDVVHGVWGKIDDHENGALWVSAQDYSIWKIKEHHHWTKGTLTNETSWNYWVQHVYLWPYDDIAGIAAELKELSKFVEDFNEHLRHRGRPPKDEAWLRSENSEFLRPA